MALADTSIHTVSGNILATLNVVQAVGLIDHDTGDLLAQYPTWKDALNANRVILGLPQKCGCKSHLANSSPFN